MEKKTKPTRRGALSALIPLIISKFQANGLRQLFCSDSDQDVNQANTLEDFDGGSYDV